MPVSRRGNKNHIHCEACGGRYVMDIRQRADLSGYSEITADGHAVMVVCYTCAAFRELSTMVNEGSSSALFVSLRQVLNPRGMQAFVTNFVSTLRFPAYASLANLEPYTALGGRAEFTGPDGRPWAAEPLSAAPGSAAVAYRLSAGPPTAVDARRFLRRFVYSSARNVPAVIANMPPLIHNERVQ